MLVTMDARWTLNLRASNARQEKKRIETENSRHEKKETGRETDKQTRRVWITTDYRHIDRLIRMLIVANELFLFLVLAFSS